jgi:hypothetical protein
MLRLEFQEKGYDAVFQYLQPPVEQFLKRSLEFSLLTSVVSLGHSRQSIPGYSSYFFHGLDSKALYLLEMRISRN